MIPSANSKRRQVHGMKKLMLFAAVLGVLVWLAMTTAALADNEVLTVTQDESSMERIIEGYLKTEHKLVIEEKTLDKNDLALNLPMKGDGTPAYRIMIDTQPLNTLDNGKIIERGVRIQAFTGVKVPEDKQDAVIRVINDFNRDKVFAAVYVDSDGEIVVDWTLNVMSQGLATEYVFDVVARADKLWRELYPKVNAAM